jgi:hypothetical protein
MPHRGAANHVLLGSTGGGVLASGEGRTKAVVVNADLPLELQKFVGADNRWSSTVACEPAKDSTTARYLLRLYPGCRTTAEFSRQVETMPQNRKIMFFTTNFFYTIFKQTSVGNLPDWNTYRCQYLRMLIGNTNTTIQRVPPRHYDGAMTRPTHY